MRGALHTSRLFATCSARAAGCMACHGVGRRLGPVAPAARKLVESTCGACSCNKDGRCYPGQVGRCKNFGNLDLHDVGGSEVPQGLSAGDPPAWSGRRVQPSRPGDSAAGRTGGVPREVRNTSVSRPPSSAAACSGVAPAPGFTGSSQSSLSAPAVPSVKSLRVDLPVPVCSETVSDYAAASSSAGASSDPTAASRVPVSAAPASVGPGSSGQPQAEPSCSPASLYQPSHVRLAPLRPEGLASREPTSCNPGAPSGPGGGDPGGDGAWSLPPDELFTIFSKIYDEVVCWRRNLCMLPFGAEGSSFVRELTRLISLFSDGLPGRRYAWYAVVAACHLLLQKPLGADSSRETRRHLAGRMERWRTGDFDGLLRECRCLQAHLPTRSSSRQSDGIDDIVFAGMVSHGKVGTATRYVESNASGRVLDLSEEVAPGRRVLDVLKEKHPAPVDAQPDILLPGGPDPPEPVLYDKITPAMIRRLASRLSGAAGPSALDSAAWRRMMTSYDGASDSLCGVLSRAAKCICTETLDETCLRPFLAARLIPLDKQPGVRPIAIGEVFRRVICKAIMSAIERDVLLAVTPYQLCVGIPSACEVAVGILGQEFQSESCDGILLVDASNAFNAMNRSAALHNIPRICPAAGRAFVNLYQSDIPLFLEGGLTVLSREGTCQGDNGFL
eukprot:scpid59940/ scgid6144/ 